MSEPNVNCFGMKNEHRGWSIKQGGDDNFYAFGPNYDGSWEGEEGGRVGNVERVEALTYEALIEKIDDWLTKQNYPPADSFHWRDDIFFRVEPNGDVRCWRYGIQRFFDIPAVEWNSVVSFVAQKHAEKSA